MGNNTTIRAGFGIFYAYTGGGAAVNNMLSTPPFFVFVNLTSEPDHAADPRWPTCFPGREKSTTAVSSNQDLNQRTGYLYNYNLNIQQPAPSRTAVRNRLHGQYRAKAVRLRAAESAAACR